MHEKRTAGPPFPFRLAAVAGSAALFAMAGASVAEEAVPEQIIVRATRLEKPLVQAPAAIGVIEKDTIQLGRPQVGLDEALVQIPGLFMQDRYNFAQDLRIAIRGFGARSSFGIRGIKILVDGIPETLPDGQGQVDSVEMGSIERIEVIRGPSSSLYGNASGGVISIVTEQGPDEPYVDARLSGGEFGFLKNQVEFGGSGGDWNYYGNASRFEMDGYRDHSETENTQLNARARYAFDETASLALAFNATDSPQADDPGGLTAEEVAVDPRQAAPNNLLFDAGEAVEQQRIGLTYDDALSERHAISARTYYVARELDNLLPTGPGGIVDLDRGFYGGGFSYTYTGTLAGRADRLIVGIDIDRQDDDRKRYDNLEGTRGALSFDQNERVDSTGVFLQNEWSLLEALELTLGLRHDEVEFDVADEFLANGDDSGQLSFDHTSPMAGLSYVLTPGIDVYGNVSTSFETPTTTELANPDGGGFNESLEPQEAVNYEIGVKGTFASRHWFEAALFSIEVDNELIPFELASDPGRVFFENAGSSTRDGVELGLTLNPLDGLRVALAYTWSDFVFDHFVDDDGNDFSGNRLPGSPENQLYGELSYTHESGVYGAIDLLAVDELFLDNANTASDDSYTVSTLRMGYRWEGGGWSLEPFAGVNNLFDEDYSGNARINAFGGRYFEPAPTRNAYGGLRVGYSFR